MISTSAAMVVCVMDLEGGTIAIAKKITLDPNAKVNMYNSYNI